VNIGAGRESALAGTGNDDGLDPVIFLEPGQRVVKLAHQIVAQRVELVGPVEGDKADPVEMLADDEVVGHVRRSFPACFPGVDARSIVSA